MKKLLCLLILSTPFFASAQYKVVDADTKDPIPYAVIYNATFKKAAYTDENGEFSTKNCTPADTLIFSCISHSELRLTAADVAKQKQIALTKKDNILNEVVVNAVEKDEKTISYLPKKLHITSGSTLAFEMCLKLRFPEEEAHNLKQITRVKIRVKKAKESNPVRIHIYDVDEHGLPGKDLLLDNIILSGKDISWGQLKLDVSHYNVFTSQDAVFVSLEWLGSDENYNPKFMSDPRVRMTNEYPEELTYIRMVGVMDWRHTHRDPQDPDKPLNLLISIYYK